MSQNSNIAASILASALLAGAAFAHSAYAADTCDALYQASIKTFQTPHHAYSTSTPRGGQPKTGEAVLSGGVEYIQLRGRWMRSPMTPQEMTDEARDKLKTHPDTCSVVGTRLAGGQRVTVYKVHSKESGTDQQVRILNSSGLLQGGTATLPDGMTVDTRYEYGNVQAPVVTGR